MTASDEQRLDRLQLQFLQDNLLANLDGNQLPRMAKIERVQNMEPNTEKTATEFHRCVIDGTIETIVTSLDGRRRQVNDTVLFPFMRPPCGDVLRNSAVRPPVCQSVCPNWTSKSRTEGRRNFEFGGNILLRRSTSVHASYITISESAQQVQLRMTLGHRRVVILWLSHRRRSCLVIGAAMWVGDGVCTCVRGSVARVWADCRRTLMMMMMMMKSIYHCQYLYTPTT